MYFLRGIPLVLFYISTATAEIQAGYDASTAAQVMVNLASQSWEWGTATEALLEFYDPELSVFGSNPFPNGKIPEADPDTTFALAYARQYIETGGQTFVPDGAVGDPASLGVAALLIGQSNSAYIDASNAQANYILNDAPKYSNGAVSQRADVAELWSDFIAMAPPFLAYQAVQENNPSLMTETVTQCGLYRDILKNGQSWMHIIGPQSQDTGLWSTGNGWAAFGMVRVLHTLQKWSGSSSMTSQASQLKSWIQEILDGAMSSGLDNGLLRNYLNDDSWFGEISGTALLSAAAYRMAVNDPSMFPQQYINWADANRIALSQHESGNGVFAPAVDPYAWLDRSEYNSGSPEGQAFTVLLYCAFRDCVNAGLCQASPSSATTVSQPGVGPVDILTVLYHPLTYTSMSAPPAPTGCGTPPSCDDCSGGFNGLEVHPQCSEGDQVGCNCIPTEKTCGPHQSCDLNGCTGGFTGSEVYPQCQGNFLGCNCTVTENTCGPHQSCDLNGCAGGFTGSEVYPQCQGNFVGCNCTATENTCGPHQSCDLNGCAGAFTGIEVYPQCQGNFVGCNCTATEQTCAPQQSCGLNGCAGAFDLSNGIAYCTGNFVGCSCSATPKTCGPNQSCDQDSCAGEFLGEFPLAQCTDFFDFCNCVATDHTCGPMKSCDENGCAGGYDESGVARCQNNFLGCECIAQPDTCGPIQACNAGGCAGAWVNNSSAARCTGNFAGCVCDPVTGDLCGEEKSCTLNGCNGGYNEQNEPVCQVNYYGCPCLPSALW